MHFILQISYIYFLVGLKALPLTVEITAAHGNGVDAKFRIRKFFKNS